MMKKSFKSWIVIIFAIIMLFACETPNVSSNSEAEDVDSTENGAIKATTPASGNYSAVSPTNWATSTWKLGANFNGSDVEFAVYSKNATKVLLEIYSAKSGVEAQYEYDMKKNTSDNIWRAKVAAVPAGALYGFRVWGPNWPYNSSWARGNSSAGFSSDCDANGNRFNPNKVLFDPYAKEISHDKSNPTVLGTAQDGGMFGTGPDTYKSVVRRTFDTGKWAPKSVVVKDTTATGTKPKIAQQDAIIYEAHVRGLSKHPSVANLNTILNTVGITATAIPANYRGTYKGATYLIPYLQALGINTIEFLPVHETDNDVNPDNKPGGNFWGYMTYGYFAPDRRYSSDQSMGGPTKEFKEMVKAFHDNGMEVYLDVVYNHSGEGGNWDGTGNVAELTSLRGFDNSEYYCLVDSNKKNYWETTGCGNNLRCDNPPVRKFIIDSLTYWTDVMGVDGFRFDLAPVLGREKSGANWNFNGNATTIKDIASLGTSKNVEMIAEAWDCSGYHVGGFPNGWGEWNGRFRDAARKFIKGDSGINIVNFINGDYDNFNSHGGPQKSVNFLVAHDGFTLTDLVSYNGKNNGGAWPFGASDGGDDSNNSWSHDGNQALRRQQIRNFYTLQMFSRGIPMIVYGDELGRTQNGNNNPYNIDSVATWNNYNMVKSASPTAIATDGGGAYHNNLGTSDSGKNNTFSFAKNVINVRKNDATLRTANYNSTTYGYGQYGSGSKIITITIYGTKKYVLLVNSGTTVYNAALPAPASGKKWGRIIDTDKWAEKSNDNFWTDSAAEKFASGYVYGVNPRSMVVFKEM